MTGGTSGGAVEALDELLVVVLPEVVGRGDDAEVVVGVAPDVDQGVVPRGHLDQHVLHLGHIQFHGFLDALHDVIVRQEDLFRGHIVAGVALEGLADVVVHFGFDRVELEILDEGVDIEKGQVGDAVFHGNPP